MDGTSDRVKTIGSVLTQAPGWWAITYLKGCRLRLTREDDNYYHLLMKTGSPATLTPAPQAQRVSSEDLLGSRRELVIVHNGREYKLRLTQNGKLILTA